MLWTKIVVGRACRYLKAVAWYQMVLTHYFSHIDNTQVSFQSEQQRPEY